jgi:hypothetical protein
MRAKEAGKRKNALGGPRKSLIRLDSDKENPSLSFDCLWPGLAGFGSIWPNLAQFGFGLDFPWMSYVTHRRYGHHPEAPFAEGKGLAFETPRLARLLEA